VTSRNASFAGNDACSILTAGDRAKGGRASIARLNSAVETPDDEWRAVMDVNINGVFWCCRAFGRHMIAQRRGSIVNLGSMSGLIINRPRTAASYMASKAPCIC
jgi:NAD(P)-dependent dehydrogenase (short-subunit alcohol dehydrogenase family)